MLACGCTELPVCIMRVLGDKISSAYCSVHGEQRIDHPMTPREVTIHALGLPMDWSPPDGDVPPF